MKKNIDINSWNRKNLFHHFNSFEEPFYGVCVTVDCTKAYLKAKEMQTSFWLYYLHASLAAVNHIENFKYRIEGDNVYIYDRIDASTTVDKPDGTFGMAGSIRYYANYHIFESEATKVIEQVRASQDLITPGGNNVIHYSAVPWLNFTSLSHARKLSRQDSCPKISFGKITEISGIRSMPVSIHVHHALVDGRHIGMFVDEFQKIMNG